MRGRRCRNARKRSAGFSLLEVLVALSLLALIMAAMPSVVQLARRAWESSQAIDAAGSQQIATRFLRDRIAQAMPLAQKRADGSAPVLFEGAADRVTFVAPSIDGPPGTGLFIFDLIASGATGGQKSVLLRWRPYRPTMEGNGGIEGAGERVVLEGVTTFGLRYFGRQTATGVRGWSDVWPRASSMPELVELRIVSRNSLVANPPPMVIELLAQDVAVDR
jgi:general secretion pathway protein J